MALIDVVSCQMTDRELCIKFPSEDLKLGSQLVVSPSQVAFFVKGGKVYDMFESGTYTLKTENIPLLNKVINLPFGGKSPFNAEVWFINLTAKLDMKWGTPAPIQLEDPKYGVIVPVRAFGQYGVRVAEPRTFLLNLIGNMALFTTDKIDSYFKGKLVTELNALLAQKICSENISILDINAHLVSLSDYCGVEAGKTFLKYGMELIEFNIMSINVPQDDTSIVKLKEAKDLAARLRITGKDMYQMERSFDVLETAASNQGAGGQMMAMGAGLGAGMGIGGTFGAMTANTINTNPVAPPPLPIQSIYYVYLNGQQLGGQTSQMIANLLSQGMANANTLAWTQGMPAWLPINQIPELAVLLQTPPAVPQTPPTV